MNEHKHTPGPWHTSRNERLPYLIYASDGYVVADVKVYHGRHDIMANARLIAAAPELLDALEGVCEALEVTLSRLGVCGLGDGKDHKVDESSWGGTSELQGARAAIAKARGQS